MAQLLIRNIDDDAFARLKARAKARGRSLQAETRLILEQAAAVDPDEVWAKIDALRTRIAAKGGPRTDSVAAIREDRDR